MSEFEAIYKRLNDRQREAVDSIDGPLLVLAGPGTGKTQLLSARVANILQKTDTLPQSILCLTFTDAAALNMRERLTSMIGDQAYDVNIGTYHSFASEIIKSYPEFFEHIDLETGQDTRMERPIDEITQLEILSSIITKLPYGDPLYNAKYYVKSVVGAISDCKQAALSPSELITIAADNKKATIELSPQIHTILADMKQMPRKADSAAALFEDVLDCLNGSDSELCRLAASQLTAALELAAADKSTKPLTAWKNAWLYKNDTDTWCFTKPESADKLASLANIYEKYQAALEKAGQYDFNDMIIRTIDALQNKPELKFNLQEKYQYILLDEFQDTNAAQFKLVKELADHPVHEGRPNIMAVGDDDQGIFAFQGADIGNMLAFLSAFRDVSTINLIQNYRSHANILHVAHKVADQIESRLHHNLQNITKTIEAAAHDLPTDAQIARHEFASQASEYGWIADQIKELITAGTDPSEITVLAPKHSILEDLVPFLDQREIPVIYEKRENIFETPIIDGLLLFARTILAASKQHFDQLDELLSQLLSLPYWQINTKDIWELNWEHYRQKFDSKLTWTELALKKPETEAATTFILHLGSLAQTLSLEHMLDHMTGAQPVDYDKNTSFTSPLKGYYFGENAQASSPQEFYEAISHLSVIRSHLRDKQAQSENKLTIEDLVRLYDTYQEAEQPLVNTHPIAQAKSAVVLQTVYKSKGLEYEYVFLPSMHDDVWGSKSGGGNSKISLPANLQYITHDSSTEDTKRRLLFVAVTRAKHGLFISSYASKENGKATIAAKYIQESTIDNVRRSQVLPAGNDIVTTIERPEEVVRQDVDTLWHSRYQILSPDLRSLLSSHLERYVMSPTHLNTFTNLEYAGPQAFLLGTLLRFPQAQSPDSIYGDALHNSLEWYQKKGGGDKYPSIDAVIRRFEMRINNSHLEEADRENLKIRGSHALRLYLTAKAADLQTNAKAEVDFRKEGVVLDGAVLTGKIDRLEINEADKTVRIIDFKSGTPATKWSTESKYLNYKQQLYFYILLIEKSHTYAGYSVESARLEFIEPLGDGTVAKPLILQFSDKEYEAFKKLVKVVWDKVQNLDLPDTSTYPATSTGTRTFISDLTK